MKKILILLLLSMSSNLFAEPKGIKPNLTLSTGTVERFENFNSKYISARNVDVWLPDNYNPKNKYSVLYMHDGQMLFDASTTWNKRWRSWSPRTKSMRPSSSRPRAARASTPTTSCSST